MNKYFENEEYYPKERCKLASITNHGINSIITIELNLNLTNMECIHTFQLVDTDFPIVTDGIIGRNHSYQINDLSTF